MNNCSVVCIRVFPVMTFLFGSNLSFRKKLKVVAKLAAEHATNLAAFAFTYKVNCILRMLTLSYMLDVCFFQCNSHNLLIVVNVC